MLILNAEFLAMLLIIIYVGAIAVLLLFTVMMLQTRYHYKKSVLQTGISALIAVMVFIQLFGFLITKDLKSDGLVSTNIPLVKVAYTLYVDNFINLQVAGVILLVAMVAAMMLTLTKSSTFIRRQNINKQVLRKKEDCIIMTNPESGKGVIL